MSPAPSRMDGLGTDDTDVRDIGPWLEALLEEEEGGDRAPATPKAPPRRPAEGRPCPRCGCVGAHDARFCVQCGADVTIRAPRGAVPPNAAHAPKADEVQALSVVGQCPDCALAYTASTTACAGCHRRAGEPLFLLTVNPDGTDGVPLAPVQGEALIGRAAQAHLSFPDDAHMSPEHVRLRVGTDGAFAEDRGSLNGTFIRITEPTEMRSGDTFVIGRQILRLEAASRPMVSPPLADDGTRLLGSPPPEGSHLLVQLGVSGGVQDRYHLPNGGGYIGRDSGDVRFPTDHYVSGTHAELALEQGRCVLRDLESSNGTWVRIREETRLIKGAEIYAGSQVFRVVSPPEAAEPRAART